MKREIGERIRLARNAKGLTQENMGFELKITGTSYSNIETGKTAVTVSRLFQIAELLDADVIDLLGLTTLENTSDTDLIYKNALGEQLVLLSQQVGELQLKMDALEKEVHLLKGRSN